MKLLSGFSAILRVSLLTVALAAVFGLSASAARPGFPASADIIVIDSPNLHCADTVAVFSPSGQKAAREIPTVFLLHGRSGNWSNWGMKMDLQALSDKTGWRFICPDGFINSWYFNNADSSKMQWRTFFWEECWPMLEKRYGLNPEKTFITGLSMGGHGAMNLFLDYPERFRGAGSMSGVLDLTYSSNSAVEIPQILGMKNINRCCKESAIWRLENLSRLGPAEYSRKVIVVTCGTEDQSFYAASNSFASRCRDLGLRFISMYSPGRHSWDYWTYILPYHLGWFKEAMTE